MAGYRHRTLRQMRTYASAPALPPLMRIVVSQLTGVLPKLAPHEVRGLPKTKPSEHLLIDRRNECDLSSPLPCPARRSHTKNSILSAREVVNGLRRCRYDRSTRYPIAQIAAESGLSRATVSGSG
jgi:hypothetical protein